jgi:hypothetical protein
MDDFWWMKKDNERPIYLEDLEALLKGAKATLISVICFINIFLLLSL